MTDQTTPRALTDQLVQLLNLSPQGDSAFIGKPQPGGVGRVYGGQVIAQALQAAQMDVTDGKIAHSLHAYFLRGGEEGPPIDYHVARDFDGHSFANRRVIASQDGRPILNLTASFQHPEDGLEHDAAQMPQVPAPEQLKTAQQLRIEAMDKLDGPHSETLRSLLLRPRPIEMRPIEQLHWMRDIPLPPVSNTWVRVVAPLPDDPALHRAVIAYFSDNTLLGTSLLPHGLSWIRGEITSASLDHALWFHRPARADEWLLYTTDSPWSGGGRGFNRGQIFNRAGELVASVAQEGMIRRRRAKGN